MDLLAKSDVTPTGASCAFGGVSMCGCRGWQLPNYIEEMLEQLGKMRLFWRKHLILLLVSASSTSIPVLMCHFCLSGYTYSGEYGSG